MAYPLFPPPVVGNPAGGIAFFGEWAICSAPQPKELLMNWDTIAGNWKQATGKLKEEWGDLTDDDLSRIAGKRDQLVGRIQERYGIAKDEAERQVKEWERRYH
jgi:uncharacterized protein YjbJ (UPF0337 family)